MWSIILTHNKFKLSKGCIHIFQWWVFIDEKLGIEVCEGMKIISLPHVDEIIAPIFHTVPMQLLSYHFVLIKGKDIDQTRNLEKVVTVE